MSTAPVAAFTSATVVAGASGRNGPSKRRPSVSYIGGLNSFGGLKAHNSVASLGLPVCTQQSFALIMDSLRSTTNARKGKGGGGGGALSSTCNAVGEIFKIAAIMNGLVLVGVAVGFVLLRIEASVEEAEAE
ncbi:hypothetical protein QJS04_geneDACA016087 [Acorus gramineus]|uniref:PetM of cytochrome b6/f complex subunit 7 n=1 Tax=Acorus gramineus TaxID=55184 RepID=A0AAV9BG49_ACOGR|nr:hypothetical protein QJS04_geneDACA016087 [Acorus gramineus]